MSDRLYCRICCGLRPMTDKICLGCNTPRANAAVPQSSKPEPKTKPKCPGCGLNHSTATEPGRWVCDICHAVFEDVEFTMQDRRAEKTAEWKERRAQR